MTKRTVAVLAPQQVPFEGESTSAVVNGDAIQVRDLVKRYHHAQSNAVNGISFAVQRGEIFGLLGPNGAGKTSTISILITTAVPTNGNATIMGLDVATDPVRVKQRIAVMPQKANLDTRLNAKSRIACSRLSRWRGWPWRRCFSRS